MRLDCVLLVLMSCTLRCLTTCEPDGSGTGTINVLFIIDAGETLTSEAAASGDEIVEDCLQKRGTQRRSLQLECAVQLAAYHVNSDNSTCHLNGNQLSVAIKQSKVSWIVHGSI